MSKAIKRGARFEERLWEVEDSLLCGQLATPGAGKNDRDATRAVDANVRRVIRPLVSELRRRCAGAHAELFDALDAALRELGSGLVLDIDRALHGRVSGRELQVCRLIRDGMESKEIAAALAISAKTVEFHRNRIRRKLGLRHGSPELAEYLRSL